MSSAYTASDSWTTNSTATTDHTLIARLPPSISPAENVFVAVVKLFICFIGTVGNVAVILAVLFSRKLQNTTNVFVTSLSIADLLVSMFLVWLAVARLSDDGWPFPNAYLLCQASAFLVFICIGVSVYNMAAIAVNRLMLITRPYLYTKIYRPGYIAIMVAFTWVIPFSFGIALPLNDIGGFGYDPRDHTCSDLDAHPRAETMALVQTLVGLPVPLIVITISYTAQYFHVRRHFNRQLIHQNEMVQQNTGQMKETYQRRQAVIMRQQLDITKNLFVVTLAFVISIAPFFLFNIVPQTGGISYRINLYLSLPFLCHVAVNPIIYGIRHPQFKPVLRLMFMCRFRDIPAPSYLLQRFTKSRGPDSSMSVL